MLKAAGSIILIICSAFAGKLAADKLSARIKNVGVLLYFIKEIRERITVFRMPFDDILKELGDDAALPSAFIADAKDNIYNSAANNDLLTGDEEDAVIKQFSEKLGEDGTDVSLALCESCERRLEALLEKLKKEYPEKKRLCSTISVLAGVSVVIMII